MSYCQKCGAPIANDAKFCYNCGTLKTTATVTMLYCRKCGIQLDNDAKYCYRCGTSTTDTIPIPPQTLTPIPPPPPTTMQPPKNTYEQTFNETTYKGNLLIITISLLIITIVALIIAIVAFSPLTNIFNNQPFDQPGINTVKISIHLLRILI